MIYPVASTIYLVLLGMACVYGSLIFQHLPVDPLIFLICASIISTIYFANRYTDINEDFINGKAGIETFKHKNKFLFLSIVSAGFVLFYIVSKQILSMYLLLLLSSIVFYSFKLIPKFTKKDIEFVRIKDLPLVKNVYVALFWGISILVVPSTLSGVSFSWSIQNIILTVVLVIGSFSNTLFNDILDESGDRIHGNKTLPVLIGSNACLAFQLILVFISLLFIFVCFNQQLISRSLFGVSSIILAYPLIYLGLFGRWSRKKLAFISELDLLIVAAGLLILS